MATLMNIGAVLGQGMLILDVTQAAKPVAVNRRRRQKVGNVVNSVFDSTRIFLSRPDPTRRPSDLTRTVRHVVFLLTRPGPRFGSSFLDGSSPPFQPCVNLKLRVRMKVMKPGCRP